RQGIFARAPIPDLLLLDVNLPDGTGIDVLESMINQPHKITTVMLTASTNPEIRQRCDELHVNDYMTKPVDEAKFMRIVRDHKRLMIHSTPMLAHA
ncbi:MAG: response regulator, partial [Pirellulaceae bacterium]|nr:response regulator [Pirellulaceae bacterium]